MKTRHTMTPTERAEAIAKLEARLEVVTTHKRALEDGRPRRLGLCATVGEVKRHATWKGLLHEALTLRNSINLLREAQRCAFDAAQPGEHPGDLP